MEPVHHPTHDPVAALTLELEQGGRLSEQSPGEVFLQLPAGAVQSGLDRLGPNREEGCGLRRAQTLDFAQHEHGAEFLGQCVHRPLEQAAQLATGRQALRIWLVGGWTVIGFVLVVLFGFVPEFLE